MSEQANDLKSLGLGDIVLYYGDTACVIDISDNGKMVKIGFGMYIPLLGYISTSWMSCSDLRLIHKAKDEQKSRKN